jgi:hypothetical protein
LPDDIIQRGRRNLGDRRHVVEKCKQTAHLGSNPLAKGRCCGTGKQLSNRNETERETKSAAQIM